MSNGSITPRPRSAAALALLVRIQVVVLTVSPAALAQIPSRDASGSDDDDRVGWTLSYDAGYTDANDAWAGGSEIMHLAAHAGKLYAANGYWVDARWVIPPDAQKQSAQVLRLDAADGKWQVDLDTGRSNEFGLRYMKGNILKSVTFTRDGSGKPLPQPQSLLVMAAGANFERGGAVSAWVRDDALGTWSHTLVRHGSNAGGVRWVPRDMEVYRDKVTGVERLFLLLGNPGVTSGVYDPSTPGTILWDRHVEFPFLTTGSLKTRPLGLARANGALFLSEGSSIFRRVDGPQPRYVEILDLEEDTDTDVGGIRGLTSIENPTGPGQSLLFVWAPGGRSRSEVKRLDPDGSGGYVLRDEVSLADLMSRALDVPISYSLGGHNRLYPITHPATGELLHLIGFQGNIQSKARLRWKGSRLYAGAMYAIRAADRSYTLCEVNNAWAPGKTVLVSPRAFCRSPFGDDRVFVGGHDASRKISDGMAWIFTAPLDVALGIRIGLDAPIGRSPARPDARLLAGPVWELRIYQAGDGRWEHLVRRFRDHTDRLFKKHGMKPIGYWSPTDGTARQKRRFVYILEHASRYAAYRSWNRFSTDREWQDVLDRPEFQRVLAERPISIFLTENDYSRAARSAIEKPGGVYELRTYVAQPDQLPRLNARFRDHTTRLLAKHGIGSVAYWTPFDAPESGNTLIYLVRHASRQQADANWRAFAGDPEWQRVAEVSRVGGRLLAAPPERIFLKATEFSPLP